MFVEMWIVDASIENTVAGICAVVFCSFVMIVLVKLLRANGGCLGTRSR